MKNQNFISKKKLDVPNILLNKMINAKLICVSFNFVCGIILIQSYCVILQIKAKNVCNSMKFILLRRYLYQYRKYSTFKIVGFKIFLQGYG